MKADFITEQYNNWLRHIPSRCQDSRTLDAE